MGAPPSWLGEVTAALAFSAGVKASLCAELPHSRPRTHSRCPRPGPASSCPRGRAGPGGGGGTQTPPVGRAPGSLSCYKHTVRLLQGQQPKATRRQAAERDSHGGLATATATPAPSAPCKSQPCSGGGGRRVSEGSELRRVRRSPAFLPKLQTKAPVLMLSGGRAFTSMSTQQVTCSNTPL